MSSSTLTIEEEAASLLTGPESLKLLLRGRFGSVRAWAVSRGFDDTEVHHLISGRREYPEIRAALAKDLGRARAEIDRLFERKEGTT
jgi:hypothetical protein